MSIKSIYFPSLSNYLCIFLNFHLLYRLIMPSHFISNHPSASRILSCLPFSFSLHLFPPLWSPRRRQKRILPYIAGFFSLLFIHFNRVKHFCDRPVQRSDEYRSHYGSDADASEMMQSCQTDDCGDSGHRTVKTDFYSGKLIRPHASSHAMLPLPRSNWRSRGL